ncbi:sensor histidine kinase [Hymenobacter armeniacus]|nr:ATP-binding protein [Hymenobacter armeniacus]
MRLVLLLAALGLLFGVATAAPLPADTAVLRINRLPAAGLLLAHGWRYHPGDDPAWPRPDFDDSAWDTLNPTRPRRELPPALGTGISWLRLRFRLGDSLHQRELAGRAILLGACEVYLNGKRLTRQGRIGATAAQLLPQSLLPQPVEIRANGPSEQVLAIRYAPWHPWLLGVDYKPQLSFRLYSPARFWQTQVVGGGSAPVYLLLFGIAGLLTLLHVAFFRYNPAQRANLYFARFALTLALCGLCYYCGATLPFATQLPNITLLVLSSLLASMSGLWNIRALYALFDSRPGRVYTGLWACYGLVGVEVVVAYYHPATFPVLGMLFVVITAEQLRLTTRAIRQGRRGGLIIGAGFAGSLLIWLVAVGFLLRAILPLLVINGLILVGLLLPALAISLFLAREFALDAELLQVKLSEVEQLSAQTLAQEQEKQALLAQQNETLETQVTQRTGELQRSLTELRATQAQLIQKEKMASLGELTAGIAHEIQNPLNFVNNFSEVSTELLEELEEEQAKLIRDAELEAELVGDLRQNLGKISHHGRRAAAIVKGMLEHSRTSTGERAPTDLNQLADEYLRLAYQGLRAKDKSFNAALETDFAPGLPLVEAVGADVGRVLLNLFGNAFYAVQKRQQTGEAGYAPTVSVATARVNGHVEIRVTDNGTGMPTAVQAKIFQPFFTTKPTGEGTGLGLSLSHDIIAQGHGGTLAVESQPGAGSTFIISLPTS